MKVSICIPSRANSLGLWATIVSAHKELCDIPHEFIVCLNGQEMTEPHILLEQNGVKFIHSAEPLPPPIARNRCAQEATGEWLCFFDDHCIPDSGFFSKAAELYEIADVIHSPYTAHINYHRYYHFFPIGDNPLKGDYSREPLSDKPYECISGPHGGFLFRRKPFIEMGGYDDFWQGFGGEEAYLDMKAAQRGLKVYCHPQMLFYHFSCRSGVRGYDKTFNQDNFRMALEMLK